jgi:hypothetical protein
VRVQRSRLQRFCSSISAEAYHLAGAARCDARKGGVECRPTPGVLVTYFAKPTVAIAFGAFMLCAETCLHADALLQATMAPLDLPLYDWAAGLFLLGAGVFSRRDWSSTHRQYQSAAWAFMLSLLTGAFISQLNDWLTPPTEPPSWGISETGFVVIIAALIVIAVCGLISTIGVRHTD